MTQQQSQQEVKARLTVADYMATPDDVRYQLIDGELILAPSPNVKHQAVSSELFVALRQFIHPRGLGVLQYAPLDVVFPNHEVFQPDILFVSNERRGIMTERNIQGAPDLVVEILSPSTQRHDRGHKLTVYSQQGVREYWIVDPDAQTVEVLTEGAQGLTPASVYSLEDALLSPLLPGLSIDLAQVFEAPVVSQE